MEELLKYYSNLLIVQYNGKPKAKATIELLTWVMFANLIFLQIQNAFNWRMALKSQLDIIGKWVGVDKFYDGNLFGYQAWFSLIDWNKEPDVLQGGFSTFENFDTLQGGFLGYDNISTAKNELSPDDFSRLIGLKIIKNNINHTAKIIDIAIWHYFDGNVYTEWDLPNKELIYHHTAGYTTFMQVAAYKNALPVPSGIRLELRGDIND